MSEGRREVGNGYSAFCIITKFVSLWTLEPVLLDLNSGSNSYCFCDYRKMRVIIVPIECGCKKHICNVFRIVPVTQHYMALTQAFFFFSFLDLGPHLGVWLPPLVSKCCRGISRDF